MTKSKFNLEPLNDFVVIRPVKKTGEKASKLNIVLPESVNQERPEEGEVVAVGPGSGTDKGEIRPVSVKVGQKVIFTKYGPFQIKVKDIEYLVIRETDILCIVHE